MDVKFNRRRAIQYVAGLGLPALLLPDWLRSRAYELPPVMHQPGELAEAAPTGARRALVGGVVAANGSSLVVRDAQGLHPVVIDPSTEIHHALGAPAYDLAPRPVVRGFRENDALWIAGKRETNGSLLAEHVDINFILFTGGLVIGSGRRYVDAQRQVGRSTAFEQKISRAWLSSSVRILKLDAAGRFVPALLAEMNIGQYIGFKGYRADDGSVVADVLLLGNGEPPGQH